MQKPLHVSEGVALPWYKWFAWRPVKSEQDNWIWLRYTYRRRFCPASWFLAGVIADNSYWQYSDIQKSIWDTVSVDDLSAMFTLSSGENNFDHLRCGICSELPCNGHGHNFVPMGEV